jgi:predicted NUDIX family phosphoesterase
MLIIKKEGFFMNTQTTKSQEKNVFFKKEDEKILVVERKILFPEKIIQGIQKIDFDSYLNLIEKNKQFLWRSQVETDTNFKQIIPYLVFNFQDKFFLMQRKSNASEVRLQNLYSLGIGGHIKEKDLNQRTIFDWAKREFTEEVEYSGNFEVTPIGLLNDESNFVGQVHTGFVFLLKGNSDKIKIRDEHKEGKLYSLEECKTFYPKMEQWSQIVCDYLTAI